MTAKQASLLHLIARTQFYMRDAQTYNQHTLYSLFYQRWVVRAAQRVLATDDGLAALKRASNTARSEGAIGKDLSQRLQKMIRGLRVMRRSA